MEKVAMVIFYQLREIWKCAFYEQCTGYSLFEC